MYAIRSYYAVAAAVQEVAVAAPQSDQRPLQSVENASQQPRTESGYQRPVAFSYRLTAPEASTLLEDLDNGGGSYETDHFAG